MLKIAHRGNLNGKTEFENSPTYLMNAINLGYNVEIDIWYVGGKYYLGHDHPEYNVNKNFITKILDVSWFHCKNIDALYEFSTIKKSQYFWHQEDDFTLTSSGQIWTYPGKNITTNSIIVDLDIPDISRYTIIPYGICSDYVSHI